LDYTTVFFVRRLLFAAVIILVIKPISVQVSLLIWLSTYVVFYLCTAKPYKDPSDKKIEIFNEIALVLMIDQSFEITEQYNGKQRYAQAWFYIICFLALFAVNVGFAIIKLNLYQKYRICMVKRMQKKAMEKRLWDKLEIQ